MVLDLSGGELNAVAWLGPTLVLSAFAWSISVQAVWRRVIGEVACMYAVRYEPDAVAFGIWVVLYLLTAASVLAQLLAPALPDQIVVLDWWTNLAWGGA